MTSMDSSTPFYQKVKRRISLIAFILSCFFIGILAIFYSRESDVFVLKREILPSIEKQLLHYNLIADSEQLLTQILIANNPKSFRTFLLQYQENLKTLSKSNFKENKLINKLLAELEPFLLSVERLSVNHEKNEQLKQNMIVQLQLVNTALNDALESGVLTHQRLYQQSINLFTQAIVIMESVSISTNIERFTQFTEQLNIINQQWMDITASPTEAKNPTIDSTVVASILGLNNLLWVDQRSIAKWRGHIRISQEFITLVGQHYQALLPLNSQLKLAQLPSNNIWPKEVLPYLPPELKSSSDAYYITVASILIVFFLLLLLLLFLLSSRIKRYQQHSIALIEQRVQGKVTLPVISSEQQQTFELMNQLAQPLHSEDDYQNIKASLAQQEQQISRHAQLLLWRSRKVGIQNSSSLSSSPVNSSLVSSSRVNDVQLYEMLNLELGQCWYHAFSREVSKELITDARQAKLDNGIIERVIKDKNGRSLCLTMEYSDQQWQGTLSTQEKQAKLEKELLALNQVVHQNAQNDRVQRIEYSQKLSKMLIRTMLQSQSASLGFGVAPLNVYRHLIRMLEWSKQLQLSTLLGTKDRQVQLADVNFINELYALMANVLVDANLQRNTVSYTVDSNIIEPCKLNIRLFHQTLNHFCQTLLQEQFKGHLHLAVSMADKNSGQQILNFVFSVTNFDSGTRLPETITALTQIDEQQLAVEAPLTQYFYRLFKATYCDQLQTKVIDNGYQIAFLMPITTAISSVKAHDIIDLNQRNLVLLGNNPMTMNFVEQLAKKHQAKLSNISCAERFTEEVSIKQLTKQALAVVIVADDVLTNDLDLVNQHIHTLPKELQPKVFVLQPLCNQSFHRVGMYHDTQRLLNATTFAEELKGFIKGDDASNLLLSADIFKPYRFSSTQVEVLLAVAEPKKHEVLQRLLHWMGLQVHLVCNPQQMQKQWSSGRYLILLNEFDDSPLMQLDVGKKVKRAIYAFSNTQLMRYQTDISDDYRHWEFKLLPNVLDINTLVKVFGPWLKEQRIVQHSSKRASALKSIEAKEATLSVTKQNHAQAEEAAFDLAKYAQNQGSSELAGFMIFDYINEIESAITQLSQSIKSQDTINAAQCLTTLLTVTKIMAANDLAHSCLRLSDSLAKKDFKSCTDAIEDIQIKYQALATYAEAI